MTNLLQETFEALEANGKTPLDVRWVGTTTNSCALSWDYDAPPRPPAVGTWDDFVAFADFEYDSGYGGENINVRLYVVGDDWWLERHDYDGSEWWEFKTLPFSVFGCAALTADLLKERE